jgi:hypothetical protein
MLLVPLQFHGIVGLEPLCHRRLPPAYSNVSSTFGFLVAVVAVGGAMTPVKGALVAGGGLVVDGGSDMYIGHLSHRFL